MSGGTGPKLAHLLERGFLSLVTGFDEHTAKRQTDEGSQKYRWLSPFVFSVERFGNDLRYPTLKNKLAARKKEIERIEGEAGAQDSSCKKEYIAFSKRKGCIPVQPEQIQDARSNNPGNHRRKKSGGKIGWKVCWCIWEMEIRSKKMPRFCREKNVGPCPVCRS